MTDRFETEDTGGLLTGFLAEEDDFDRCSLWRLGSWGAAAVGAVIVAMLANQSSMGWRRDQTASADLTRQSQQIQWVAKESQSETRRLASAIETLNGDRDRLYSRLTVVEQGLDSVTGSIARQNSAAASPQAVPNSSASASSATAEPQPAAQSVATAPVVAPVTTAAAAVEKPPLASDSAPSGAASANASAGTPATPLMASKSIMAPPDAAAAKLIEAEAPPRVITAAPMPDVVASLSLGDAELDGSPVAPRAVQRTEFAVDIGGANSIDGLRALWRGLLRSHPALAALRPVIALKEGGNRLGMQLRLVAGPLVDAAAAAKICAVLTESQRRCATTVFDGQRLAMKAEDPPVSVKPAARRRGGGKRAAIDAPAKKPETSTISSLFGKQQASQ